MMNLYLLSQVKEQGYDSCIVAAKTRKEAKLMHPYEGQDITTHRSFGDWVKNVKDVECLFIGKAAGHIKKSVLCASFNAG